jgi:hypothetical protein
MIAVESILAGGAGSILGSRLIVTGAMRIRGPVESRVELTVSESTIPVTRNESFEP